MRDVIAASHRRPGRVDRTRPLARSIVVALAVVLAGCAAPAIPIATEPLTVVSAPPSGAPSTAPVAVPSSPGSAITEAGLGAQLDALAAVSTREAGFRAVGGTGLTAAADLVERDLRALGWQVSDDRFTTPGFVDPGGSSVVVGGDTFTTGDVAPLIFAPAGDVSGPVVAIGWDATAAAPNGRGCTTSDYGDLPDEAIVLVAPGPCIRRVAIQAAQAAGAAAFVAGYPAAEPGAVLRPTLLDPTGIDIPAVGATRPVGDALAAAAASGGTARLVSKATTETVETRSIIAELPGSQPGVVVMLGAHLDSVVDGPGINDNGSGVAALLEIAAALRDSHPRATIRLGLWTAEEIGLFGSGHYVAGLTPAQRDEILVYLNADMLASPNGFAGVYEDSSGTAGGRAVSERLTAAVERAGGVPLTAPVGGSDHRSFEEAGVLVGGVHSGANELLTAEEAAAGGSTAGKPADACYHQACDDRSNVRLDLGRILTAALADVAAALANDPVLP